VASALGKLRLSGYDIEIDVHRGVVTLSGEVADAEARSACEKVAATAAGVTRVVNRLTVQQVLHLGQPK
jgi:osmotically-inducible protein OsmY